MKIKRGFIPALLFALLGLAYSVPKKKVSLLVFSKTAGYRHASIAEGKKALLQVAQENNFAIDTTEDATVFTDKSLKKYSAVIFLNTTGDVLNPEQQVSFEHFIQSGKGFMGIHAATDTEYDWAWFAKLVGANFESHPKIQKAKLNVTDQSHIATKHLPAVWERTDEWYNFKDINTAIQVIISIDEKSYEGGKNGSGHPMAWYHAYEGGKSFYTALGHTPESYTDPLFLQHLLGGIKYVTGKK
ncbi:MAG: ThuA domain-containing protein [Bacteroidota bacterium]|nr:ThuA domain-containing protein [Bacteroidota bacterium]